MKTNLFGINAKTFAGTFITLLNIIQSKQVGKY